MTLGRNDGLEVPLHRSLVEPMTVAGLPRMVAFLLWTSIAAMGFGLRQLWVLPIGLVFHLAGVAATKSDPYFFELLVLALRSQRRLEP